MIFLALRKPCLVLTDDEADDTSRTTDGPSTAPYKQRSPPRMQSRESAPQDNATLFLNRTDVSDDVGGAVVEHKPIPDNLSSEC